MGTTSRSHVIRKADLVAQAPLTTNLIIEILEHFPTTLTDLTRGFSDHELARRVEPEEWSVKEILAHLRVSAIIFGEQRIGAMLSGDEPTIHTVRPSRAPVSTAYLAIPFLTSLEAYVAQRERLLSRLRALEPAEWQRGATLTGVHPARPSTVHAEANALARHEVRHLAQIKRVVALLHIDLGHTPPARRDARLTGNSRVSPRR
jgi:hypothetical protein